MDTFKFPWRLEVRSSLFHPWRGAMVFTTLESALPVYRRQKRNYTRIRVN